MQLRKIIYLLTALLFTGFVSPEKKHNENKKPEWAIKFADAVMFRSDSLIYYDRDRPKYEYDYALLGSAIDMLKHYDTKYSEYSKAYIDYFVQEDGTINGYKLSDYNIDRIRPGLNMLELYERTGQEKYKKAVQTLVSQMEKHPRTQAGGFWHKKSYPWQMWLDGIYMASPFLVKYATQFNEPKWYDEVSFQIRLIYEKTLDKQSGLVYHAWDESRNQKWSNPQTGQSKHFWSRATGWYLMALVDVLDFLPENHAQRKDIIHILNQLSKSLLRYQDPTTGLWYQVIDMGEREGN